MAPAPPSRRKVSRTSRPTRSTISSERRPGRDVFAGHILGVGTTTGTRVVVGCWDASPFGPFADLMLESPDGHRTLVAPTREVAEYVGGIYTFDEHQVAGVCVSAGADGWRVRSLRLHLDVGLGLRTAVGRLLRVVPRRLGRSPAFTYVTDPVARVVLEGVRTRGVGPDGTRRWYAAHDEHGVTSLRGTLDGQDLGALARVDPVHFGFGSTPKRPSVVAITSMVARRDDG